MSPPNDKTFPCPHCGAQVRQGSRACPECGSDKETGWSEDADRWEAQIPTGYGKEDDFDYDTFVQEELKGGGRRLLGIPAWLILLLAGLALASLLLLARG